MSFDALSWASHAKTGDSKAKLVLLALAEHHNRETGQCNPSLTTLSEYCELSKRSVQRALDILEDNSFLKREHQYRSDGSKSSTQYMLFIVAPVNHHRPVASQSAPMDTQAIPKDSVARHEPGIEQGNESEDIETPKKPRKHRKQQSNPYPGKDAIRPWVKKWCLQQNIDLEAELEEFEDYILSHGRKEAYSDWPATFRNSCRNRKKWGVLHLKPTPLNSAAYREQPGPC